MEVEIVLEDPYGNKVTLTVRVYNSEAAGRLMDEAVHRAKQAMK